MKRYKLYNFDELVRIPALSDCDRGAPIDAVALARLLEARYPHQYSVLRSCGVYAPTTGWPADLFTDHARDSAESVQDFSHIGEHCGIVAFVAGTLQQALCTTDSISPKEKEKLRAFSLVETSLLHDALKPLDLLWLNCAQSRHEVNSRVTREAAYRRALASRGLPDSDVADLLRASFLGADDCITTLLQIEEDTDTVRLKEGEWGHKLLLLSDAMVATGWSDPRPGGDSYIMTPAERVIFSNLKNRYPEFPLSYGINKSTGKIQSVVADSGDHYQVAGAVEFLIWLANSIAAEVSTTLQLKAGPSISADRSLCGFIREKVRAATDFWG